MKRMCLTEFCCKQKSSSSFLLVRRYRFFEDESEDKDEDEERMKKTIIVSSEFLGQGDDELGRMLMGSFLRKLCLAENLPREIIFYNAGVKLLAEGSTVLDGIEMLSQKGVNVTACGTCVNFFKVSKLVDPVQVGDMAGIIAELMGSDHVITV